MDQCALHLKRFSSFVNQHCFESSLDLRLITFSVLPLQSATGLLMQNRTIKQKHLANIDIATLVDEQYLGCFQFSIDTMLFSPLVCLHYLDLVALSFSAVRFSFKQKITKIALALLYIQMNKHLGTSQR